MAKCCNREVLAKPGWGEVNLWVLWRALVAAATIPKVRTFVTALCLTFAASSAAGAAKKKRAAGVFCSPTKSAAAAKSAATAKTAAPAKGEERVEVGEVFSAGDGQYVVILRTQGKPARYLPIWVGETEAVAIRMRLDRQVPPRPLTLDLLDGILKAGSIKVTEVAIDDYKGGVFLGRIRLKQGNKAWDMEARPSDASAWPWAGTCPSSSAATSSRSSARRQGSHPAHPAGRR